MEFGLKMKSLFKGCLLNFWSWLITSSNSIINLNAPNVLCSAWWNFSLLKYQKGADFPGGGITFTKIVLVDVPARPRKSDFLFTNFFVQFSTHQYSIFERKAPNFDQIGCFFINYTQFM